MNKKNKNIVLIFFLFLFFIGFIIVILKIEKNNEDYYIYSNNLEKDYTNFSVNNSSIIQDLSMDVINSKLPNISTKEIVKDVAADIEEKKEVILAKKILISNVPFASQAPFGDWKDQRQQDGCEESSALMAVKWAREETLTKQESLNEIIGASDYILEKHGEYRDISSSDTVDWIIKDYFGYDKVELKKDISLQDIINELNNNNLIIIPMNGQLLNNPNFTPPGPTRHMLVARGYDSDKKVIITNDPGTRNGELYEYNYDIFFDAIRDYPTGYHKPIEKIEKNMIIIKK